jgi:hypothetical protein
MSRVPGNKSDFGLSPIGCLSIRRRDVGIGWRPTRHRSRRTPGCVLRGMLPTDPVAGLRSDRTGKNGRIHDVNRRAGREREDLWVLDVASHRPDVPGGTRYGLGLWDSVAATLTVELALFAAGVAIYATATRARDAPGRWGFAGLIAFLLLAYFGAASARHRRQSSPFGSRASSAASRLSPGPSGSIATARPSSRPPLRRPTVGRTSGRGGWIRSAPSRP